MSLLFENDKTKKNIKKTRQGSGRGTKLGNKNSKKHYCGQCNKFDTRNKF